MNEPVVFEAPEKGQWISLRDHFPRAVTPEYSNILCLAAATGEAVAFAEYGMPVKTLEMRPVNGHIYMAPVPLVGTYSNSLPPAGLLKVAARLAPPFRRRNRAAARALADRPWLAVAQRWYAVEREQWANRCLALQAVDVDSIDVPTLVGHLRSVRQLALAGYTRHFSLHGPDLIPTGMLLARSRDWGIDVERVLPLLAGSSPASMGSGPTLDALQAAVRSSEHPPGSIDELRGIAPGELDAFLTECGIRLVSGYDIDSLSLGELPSLVVNAACAAPRVGPATVGDCYGAALRAEIEPAFHSEFDQLVHDAQATFGMRDDNGALTGAWPMGLLRRAMLAAGRRLTAGGRLGAAGHAIEVTVDELVSALEGRPTVTADAVASRARHRAELSLLEPPLTLGPEVDFPVDALPAPMRTIARAQLSLRDTFTVPVGEERTDLHGEGIGPAAYTGRACVAADPADALARLMPGDVLVACGTTPAYNLALSIAGAAVVEEGGMLSHAAVIARELGLPAVIGTGRCMRIIHDGDLVEVDPAAGRVRVVGTR